MSKDSSCTFCQLVSLSTIGLVLVGLSTLAVYGLPGKDPDQDPDSKKIEYHADRKLNFHLLDFSECYPSLVKKFPEVRGERYIIYSDNFDRNQISFSRTCSSPTHTPKILTCEEFDKLCGIKTFKYIPCPEGYYQTYRSSNLLTGTVITTIPPKFEPDLNQKDQVCKKINSPNGTWDIGKPLETRNIPETFRLGD